MCFQSRKENENASSHLNLELVSENKDWLCSSASVETDKDIRYDKKQFDWMNENSCFVEFKDENCCEVLVKEHMLLWIFRIDCNKQRFRK